MTVPGVFSPAQVWTSGANTNPTLAHPDPRAGDLCVASIAVRPSTVTLATPSGWTLQYEQTGTDGGGEGADTGSVRFLIYTKVADGTEGNTTQAWTKTGTASVWIGNITQVRSATGTYDILPLGGAINGDTTSWQVAAVGASGNFVEDDLVMLFAAQNGDLSNTSGWDVFGVNLGASTKTARIEHGEYASGTGNDVEVGMAACNILPGQANTSTVTLSVTQSVACSGVLACLRIRQGAGAERTDVWVRAAGAQAAGSTSPAPAYPENRAGDRLILAVIGRNSVDGNFTTPTDWDLIGSWIGGSGTFGVDSGNCRVTLFYRDVSTILEGTQSVGFIGGNTAIGQIFAIAKDSADTWDAVVATGGGRTVQDPWSLALENSVTFTDGAVVLSVFGINGDVMTGIQSPSLSASGVTFGDVTGTSFFETTIGNDSALAATTGRVAAGGTAIPTVGVDFTGTAGTNCPAGAIGLVVVNIVTAEALSTTGTITLTLAADGDAVKAAGASGAIALQVSPTDDVAKGGVTAGGISVDLATLGDAVKVAQALGEIAVAFGLTGDVVAEAGASTTGTVSIDMLLAATAAKNAQAAAALALALAIAGDATKTGQTAAALGLDLDLVAAAAKTGTTSGPLAVALAIAATATKAGQTTGTISITTELDASATKAGSVAGAIPLTIDLTGDATVPPRPTSGTIDLQLAATGQTAKTGTTIGALALVLALVGLAERFELTALLGPRHIIDLTDQRAVVDTTTTRTLIDITADRATIDTDGARTLVDATATRAIIEV